MWWLCISSILHTCLLLLNGKYDFILILCNFFISLDYLCPYFWSVICMYFDIIPIISQSLAWLLCFIVFLHHVFFFINTRYVPVDDLYAIYQEMYGGIRMPRNVIIDCTLEMYAERLGEKLALDKVRCVPLYFEGFFFYVFLWFSKNCKE